MALLVVFLLLFLTGKSEAMPEPSCAKAVSFQAWRSNVNVGIAALLVAGMLTPITTPTGGVGYQNDYFRVVAEPVPKEGTVRVTFDAGESLLSHDPRMLATAPLSTDSNSQRQPQEPRVPLPVAPVDTRVPQQTFGPSDPNEYAGYLDKSGDGTGNGSGGNANGDPPPPPPSDDRSFDPFGDDDDGGNTEAFLAAKARKECAISSAVYFSLANVVGTAGAFMPIWRDYIPEDKAHWYTKIGITSLDNYKRAFQKDRKFTHKEVWNFLAMAVVSAATCIKGKNETGHELSLIEKVKRELKSMALTGVLVGAASAATQKIFDGKVSLRDVARDVAFISTWTLFRSKFIRGYDGFARGRLERVMPSAVANAFGWLNYGGTVVLDQWFVGPLPYRAYQEWVDRAIPLRFDVWPIDFEQFPSVINSQR